LYEAVNCRVMVMSVRKVTLMEDSEQNIHLKNLSSHQASNEEEALNLLFLGDTSRMIAEVRCRPFILNNTQKLKSYVIFLSIV